MMHSHHQILWMPLLILLMTVTTNCEINKSDEGSGIPLRGDQESTHKYEASAIDYNTEQPQNEHNFVVNHNPRPGQISLVIVFDGTGSMMDDLTQLRNGAKQIIEEITHQRENPVYNYIFVPFRDPNVGPTLVTTDQQVLLSELNNFTLHGGGDCPESALAGITKALELALPKSIVYVFTDAIANDFHIEDGVMDLIQRKQATITFLLTGYCKHDDVRGYDVFEKLAAASNGQIFNLNKTDITEVLVEVKNSLNTHHVPLTYINSKGADSHQIRFNVDDNLKELSVSVAGTHPNIHLTQPLNIEPPFEQKEVLNLKNLKVVSVNDPRPGEWQVTAGSQSKHSVKVAALSTVTFDFGFSLEPPGKDMSETSLVPLLNKENYLTISPVEDEMIANLTDVSLVLFYGMDDEKNTVSEFKRRLLPVVLANGHTVFMTEPFQPPRQLFKIKVHGFDINGYPLDRLLSTVVKSSGAASPIVTIPVTTFDIEEGDSVTLQCQIDSMLPVAGEWRHGNRVVLHEDTSQSTLLEYDIPSATLLDKGKYSCVATNSEGSVQDTVYVRVNPIEIQLEASSNPIVQGTFVEFRCIVSPINGVNIRWTLNGAELQHILPSHSFVLQGTTLQFPLMITQANGNLTCTGTRGSGEASASMNVNVLSAPELVGSDVENITIVYGEVLDNLNCSVNANPKVQDITWTFTPVGSTTHRGDNGEPQHETPFVENFQPHDAGVWECNAFNQLGSVRKKFSVKGVAGERPSLQRPLKSEITINAGDDLEMTCKCDLCMPITDYYWQTIVESQNVEYTVDMDEKTGSFRAKMRIENVSDDMAGAIRCVVQNDYGEDRIEVKVSVLVPPSIEDYIHPKDVLDGSSTYIRCVVKGTPAPIINWFKDGEPMVYSGRIFTVDNNTSTDLVIANAVPEDAGIYGCNAINSLGDVTKNFSLLVVVPPKLTSISSPLQSNVEGMDVILPCAVYAIPPPTINWFLNGYPLPRNDNKYTQTSTGLQFKAAASDSGIYECRADNNVGNVTQEMMLLIYVNPKINSPEDEIVNITSNSDVIFTCDAVGFPSPHVSWKYNGGDLLLYEKINQDEYSNELVMNNLTKSNEGAYICDATNIIGVSQKVFYLVINDPPVITSTFEEHIVLMPNEERVQQCEAVGNPAPRIYWLFDGEAITENNTLVLTASSTLDGNYTCVASNDYGEHTKIISVKKIVPPQSLSTGDTMLSLEPGNAVDFICPIEKFDTISWFKNGLEMVNIHSPQIEITHAMGSANYTCIAANVAGKASATVNVDALEAPEVQITDDVDIFGNPREVSVNEGDPFELDCPTTGNPVPEIKWLHNDKMITTKQKIIVVAAEESHSGVYTCIATNSLGSSQKSNVISVNLPTTYVNGERYKDVKLIVNSNVTLGCEMEAHPPPTLQWFKDGSAMSEYQEPLIIPNVQPADQGVYKCVASNGLAADFVQYNLTIIGPPRFSDANNTNIKLHPSESATLECPVIDEANFQWFKENVDMLTNERKLLIADQMGPGNYTCVAKNEAGENSYTFVVDVLSVPNVTSPVENDVERTVKEGEPFELTCVASGNPKPEIIWKKNDKIVSNDNVLRIDASERQDTGLYTCVASNFLGISKKTQTLFVTTSPTYKNGDRNQLMELQQGDTMTLDCAMDANPPAIHIWFKNGSSLPNNDEKLVIEDVHLSDAGVYRCEAMNPFGNDTVNYNVDVFGSPVITRITDDIFTSSIGNERLECEAIGNPMPILSWLHNGRVVLTVSYDHLKAVDLNDFAHDLYPIDMAQFVDTNIIQFPQGELLINKETGSVRLTFTELQQLKGNENKMKCVATNVHGSSEAEAVVHVLEPPTLEHQLPGNQTVHIVEGLPLQLKCIATGNPKPTVNWYKNDVQLDATNPIIRQWNAGTQLHIQEVSRRDNGIFICKATNSVGTAVQRFDINVLAPPSIPAHTLDTNSVLNYAELVDHIVVNVGDDVTLACNASGNPTPIIYWTKFNAIGSLGYDVLPIHSQEFTVLSIETSSLYACYANNTLGVMEKAFHIEVMQAPKVINQSTKADSTYSVSQYHGITLNCEMIGNPEPTITWLKDNKQLWRSGEQSGRNHIVSTNGQHFRVTSATRDDAGLYECRGRNVFGHDNKIFNLSVYVPTHWSSWQPWSECSNKCGHGMRHRMRSCLLPNGAPADSQQHQCYGPSIEEDTCFMPPCPVNGGWSEFGEWSSCSKSCTTLLEPSIRTRYRQCNSPLPSMGGMNCAGDSREVELCIQSPCKVDGKWSEWGEWEPCPVTCGIGKQKRFRKCNNPPPNGDGMFCYGPFMDIRDCARQLCSVDGGWSDWSDWSQCSQTCGRGVKSKKRECNNPVPQGDGKDCVGSNVEMQFCTDKLCPSSNLVKDLTKKKINNFTPHMTFEVEPLQEPNHHPSGSVNNQYSYSEGRPVEHASSYQEEINFTEPDNYYDSVEENENATVSKVIIKMETTMPITKEVVQMTVNTGAGAMTVGHVQHCATGFTWDYSHQQCIDIDECATHLAACPTTQVCINTIGSYACQCNVGYMLMGTKCLDINECIQKIDTCTHICYNTAGSYRCDCPENYAIQMDGRSCVRFEKMRHIRPPRDDGDSVQPAPLRRYKYAEMRCSDGYYILNEMCEDIDECDSMEHDCSDEQTCLNTRGSYLCVPTTCHDDYERHNSSGQCVQYCNPPTKNCTNGATIAQTISFTILSIKELEMKNPVLKLVSYDIDRTPLQRTDFMLDNTETEVRDAILLEKIVDRDGIAYLHAKPNIFKDKLYRLQITGRSYEHGQRKLTYYTKFVVYLYVIS